MPELPIIVSKDAGEDAKGIFGGDTEFEVKQLSTDHLRRQLDSIKSGIDSLFADMTFAGGYELRAIEVGVEVTAEGGINLIGSAKFGSKGAILLKFERP